MSGAIFAVILGASAIASALLAQRIPLGARAYLRFAAALLLALASAQFSASIAPSLGAAASAVALLVAALAPAALALAVLGAFSHPPPRAVAALALIFAFVAGMAAAFTGLAPLAFAPLLLAAFVMGLVLVRRSHGRVVLQGTVSVFAFLLGAFALLGDVGSGQAQLFFACAILGMTLTLSRASNLAVEEQRDLRQAGAIAR